MSDVQTEIKAPAKRKTKKRRSAPAAKPAKETSELAGITAKDCPRACTAEHCVISTVASCKHPFKTSVNGCGPITMANREKARKLIKHQIIDATG